MARSLLTFAIVSVAGLIVGMLLRGGGRIDVFGIRISFTRLYTPVLILTLLVGVRVWLSLRPRFTRIVHVTTYAQYAVVAGIACILVLSPVLSASGSLFTQRQWISPSVWWRNSAPGVDLLAFFAPNPLNPLFGGLTYDWFASLPGGFNENVASVSWVALITIVLAALWYRGTLPRGWVAFTIIVRGPGARAVHLDRQAPDLRSDAVGDPALPADRRRGADADAADGAGDRSASP